MSIRPVDFSGMIQRTQDFGNIKQQEDNKPMIQQHNIEVQQQKQEDHLTHQVQHSEEKENEGFRYDAKEKGNNHYEGNFGKNKKQKKEQKPDGKVRMKGTSGGFDVKI